MKEDSGIGIDTLRVDGGASANDFLMQFQSDISDLKIERPVCVETTALGAAYLAGLAVGYWKDADEIRRNWECSRTFTPSIPGEKRAALLKGWARAVRCAIFWAKEEENDE